MTTHKGGCLCGGVRIEVTGEPYRVGVCHCLDCRKGHGAIFRTFAMYPDGAVRSTGETATYRHKRKVDRHFCPKCGSPLFQTEDGTGEVEVFVGCFDEPSRVAPTYELWMPRREAWLPELPVKIRYDGNRQGKGHSEP
jgi:hypothetical protein